MPDVTPLPEKYPKKQKEGQGMSYQDPALGFPKPVGKKRKKRK